MAPILETGGRIGGNEICWNVGKGVGNDGLAGDGALEFEVELLGASVIDGVNGMTGMVGKGVNTPKVGGAGALEVEFELSGESVLDGMAGKGVNAVMAGAGELELALDGLRLDSGETEGPPSGTLDGSWENPKLLKIISGDSKATNPKFPS